MPEIVIGSRRIEYDVRQSERAQRKRIEVTLGKVAVIVPESTSSEDVERFVESRRRWLHDKTEEVREKAERLRSRTPEGTHSGAKVLFRGRFLRLRVEAADVDNPELSYRTGFHIRVPESMDVDEREAVVRRLLRQWLDGRLEDDAWEVVRRRGRKYGLDPRDVRIKDQKTLWGSCGRDRIIRLDRKLTRVPKPVLEYVVVHELCHLKYRDHSPEFWSLLGRVLPGYQERKEWLAEHEVRLG